MFILKRESLTVAPNSGPLGWKVTAAPVEPLKFDSLEAAAAMVVKLEKVGIRGFKPVPVSP